MHFFVQHTSTTLECKNFPMQIARAGEARRTISAARIPIRDARQRDHACKHDPQSDDHL